MIAKSSSAFLIDNSIAIFMAGPRHGVSASIVFQCSRTDSVILTSCSISLIEYSLISKSKESSDSMLMVSCHVFLDLRR